MNAVLHAFAALEPKSKYNGFEDIESSLQKFAVRCHYRITQHGYPSSRPNMGPDADGVRTEIEIVSCSLVQRETDEELSRPLSDFTADELAEMRDEIEERLNEEAL